MVSCVHQEIIFPFHHVFVCVQTHTFCDVCCLSAFALFWISHVVLAETDHALVEWNFWPTCIHIHLLILSRHLYHLILLVENLLLQIQLTVLLWVLSQIRLIDDNLHLLLILWLNLLLLIWHHFLIALGRLTHVLYELILLTQSLWFHTVTFYLFVLNMTLRKDTVYSLLLSAIIIISLSVILTCITRVTRLLLHWLWLGMSLDVRLPRIFLNLWLVLHH